MSDFEDVKARADLREYAAQHLEPAPGRTRDNYVCPVCGSGTGKNKSAAFYVLPDGQRAYCHACHWEGDIFDLAGALNDETEKPEQLRLVAEWAHVELEERPGGGGFANSKVARMISEGAAASTESAEAAPDYAQGREKHRRYIAECAARMAEQPTDEILSYLSARGITHAEAVTLGIGYDPHPAHGWQDEAGNWHNTPRLVLPWAGCDYYHIDRAIDDRAQNLKYDKPSRDEVGTQPLYNPQAFDHDYIVAVEGALDAIALQLCGLNAVALGGTAVNDFANEAAARGYSGVVIDMLDADGDANDPKNRKGRGAGADLVTLLGEAGITTFARAEYGIGENDDYMGHKDAGEWFAADRDGLAGCMCSVRDFAHDKAKHAEDSKYREAMKKFSVKDPATVARDVLELRGIFEPVPTGIRALDDALGGGLSLGETTFFGAVSSYGKTSLAVQVADHIASCGRSVLFVTIEQSAKELIAKSLSRLVFTENATGWNIATPNEITSLRARRAWGEGQGATLSKAVADYNRMIAPRMRILEGTEQPTVRDVRAVASIMKEHDGQAPIIFVDYLQLFAPLSERYDDKRNADVNVSELRKLARDLVTHVWCISSLNRSSYSGVISMDSFKESGGIEFGADNLLGLQPRDMAGRLADVSDGKMKREADKLIRENKKKAERDCELVVLKQRNGALPDEPLPLFFKPRAAYFYEPAGGAVERGGGRVVL